MDILLSSNVMSINKPLMTTILLVFTTIILLIWYSARKHNYWKKLGVPHIKPYLFIGSAWENTRKTVHDVEHDRYNKFGRIYGYYEGNRPFLSVAEPEIIRNILIKDFPSFTSRRSLSMGGKTSENMLSVMKKENWKRVRTIVTTIFTTAKLKRMVRIFKDCSQTLLKNFREAAEKDEVIDAKKMYGALTMDIIARSAFSTKIDSYNDPNNPFVQTARSVFTKNVNWRFVLFSLFPGLMKFLRIGVYPSNGLKFFTEITLQIIEERIKTGQTRNDMLQLLMDTTKELSQDSKLKVSEMENDNAAENYRKRENDIAADNFCKVENNITAQNDGKEENDSIFKGVSKKSLSFNELVATCITLFMTGYETTASTLSYVTYLLALHPEIQERLIQELDEVLTENDGELTYEAIQNLKYLDNVILETLRIYSPLSKLTRIADENYKLPNSEIIIPKGTVISIPICAMQKDPKNFPEPEKFDPDRFNDEERAKRNPYTYMPFGAGPRNCVARRFALIEVKMCLASVLSNYRIKRCSQTKVPLDWYISQVFLQAKKVSVKMEMRKDAVKAL